AFPARVRLEGVEPGAEPAVVRIGGAGARHGVPVDVRNARALRHAADGEPASGALPRGAQELDPPAGRIHLSLLRRRLARAHDRLRAAGRSEEHTSELQSLTNLV